jgi:WS/DGAT/MGAT family acyltransferase
VILDVERTPAERAVSPQSAPPGRVPSSAELVSQALVGYAVRPIEIVRIACRTGRAVLDVRRTRQRATGTAALPLTAPRTSLNNAVTARRVVGFAATSLEETKRLKNELGTTVNDVVLAVCTGALRRYLLAGDELPGGPLVAVVPISVAPDVAQAKGANKVSAMFVKLPTHLHSPIDRVQFIHEGTKGAKSEHRALGADTLQNWAEHASPNVFALAARLYTAMRLAERHRPIANLVISNVPGPDFSLYLGGAELQATFPLGPVMDGMGLNITIMSYRGVLYWGLVGSTRTVPRLWHLGRAVPEAHTELALAAGIEPQPFDARFGLPADHIEDMSGSSTQAPAET